MTNNDIMKEIGGGNDVKIKKPDNKGSDKDHDDITMVKVVYKLNAIFMMLMPI